jgi:hypothetical protein
MLRMGIGMPMPLAFSDKIAKATQRFFDPLNIIPGFFPPDKSTGGSGYGSGGGGGGGGGGGRGTLRRSLDQSVSVSGGTITQR